MLAYHNAEPILRCFFEHRVDLRSNEIRWGQTGMSDPDLGECFTQEYIPKSLRTKDVLTGAHFLWDTCCHLMWPENKTPTWLTSSRFLAQSWPWVHGKSSDRGGKKSLLPLSFHHLQIPHSQNELSQPFSHSFPILSAGPMSAAYFRFLCLNYGT